MPSAFDQLRHQIHIIATADVFRESPRRAYDPAVAHVAVSRRSSHGRDEAEDARLEKQMLSDAKERAEHVMLVDLGRNDLGRVSEYGSVKVRDLMYVERYSHVIHTVSC